MRKSGSAPVKVVFEGDYRRKQARLGGHRDGLGRAVRPEVEMMVAEVAGVETHPGRRVAVRRQSRGSPAANAVPIL